MKAFDPEKETERLRTLRLYDVLDATEIRMFNDLTRLAAAICETPISLITMVDQDQQFIKAGFGADVSQTSRNDAFCAHALDIDDLLIVENAVLDERFADNPFVTGDPAIRFYAGAPLKVGNGHTLGTLCVIDSTPRTLTDNQKQALRILRDTIVSQLELRRAREDIKALRTLLPMCAWCRSIRTDEGQWVSLHEYVRETQPVSHGICPTCSRDVS